MEHQGQEVMVVMEVLVVWEVVEGLEVLVDLEGVEGATETAMGTITLIRMAAVALRV